MSLIFRAALVMILSTSSAAAAAVEFTGTYRLTRAAFGLCEARISGYLVRAFRGADSFSIGPYFFPEVNGGRRLIDDAFERGAKESFTTGHGLLVFEKSAASRHGGSRIRWRIEARLSGERLRLSSRNRGDLPGYVECHYHRTSHRPFEGYLREN
jgi:hypothetical protein